MLSNSHLSFCVATVKRRCTLPISIIFTSIILIYLYVTPDSPVLWISKINNIFDADHDSQIDEAFQHKIPDSDVPFSSGLNWPPENLIDLRDPKTGYYRMILPITVSTSQSHQADPIEAYVDYLHERAQQNNIDAGKNLSLRQLVELDQEVRIRSMYPNYMLYPQALDLPKTIEKFWRGESFQNPPINNVELNAIHLPKYVCNPTTKPAKQYDVIVVIKSCALCASERNHVRQTFMQPKLWMNRISIGFVFVVGQPVSNPYLTRTFYGHTITVQNRVPQIKLSHAIIHLQQEANRFGDMLVGSFEDTYFNLTLKQMIIYRWATIFCQNQVKLFLSMDHDRALIPENLVKFIKALPAELHGHLSVGIKEGDTKYIHRPSKYKTKQKLSKDTAKWEVSMDEIPWSIYPGYLTGPCHMIGYDVVREVSIAHAFTRQFRIEDAYLGIILTKLNRIPVHDPRFLRHLATISNFGDAICVPQKEADRLYDWNQSPDS